MDEETERDAEPRLTDLARFTIGTTFIYVVAFAGLAAVGNYAGLYIAEAIIAAFGIATLVLALRLRRTPGASRTVAIVCASVIALPLVLWLGLVVVPGVFRR